MNKIELKQYLDERRYYETMQKAYPKSSYIHEKYIKFLKENVTVNSTTSNIR